MRRLGMHQFLQRSGKGEYVGDTAFASEAEIFDSPYIEDSLIYGGQIFDRPTIVDSSLSGFCRISGRPTIKRSHISGTAQVLGYSKVIESTVAENAVIAGQAMAANSFILGNARLIDKAYVQNAIVEGQAMVCETGQFIGLDYSEPTLLDDWNYICEGIWHRPPMLYVASSGFVVTESIGRKVVISCTNNTVEKWLDKGAGRRYGKLIGLDKSQIDELESAVEWIRKEKDKLDYDMNV